MDSVATYSVASLAWLAAQAVPLIIWPSLITTLLRVDTPPEGPHYGIAHASLEQYFARSLGLTQLALGSLLLVLSGTLPLNSMADGIYTPSLRYLFKPPVALTSSPAAPPADATAPTPYATAAVFVSALYHAATASYSYSRYYTTRGQLGYLFGCLGASLMAVFGLWVLMFAGPGNRRVSRRTGADKSTSGWPFRNVEADRKRR